MPGKNTCALMKSGMLQPVVAAAKPAASTAAERCSAPERAARQTGGRWWGEGWGQEVGRPGATLIGRTGRSRQCFRRTPGRHAQRSTAYSFFCPLCICSPILKHARPRPAQSSTFFNTNPSSR